MASSEKGSKREAGNSSSFSELAGCFSEVIYRPTQRRDECFILSFMRFLGWLRAVSVGGYWYLLTYRSPPPLLDWLASRIRHPQIKPPPRS